MNSAGRRRVENANTRPNPLNQKICTAMSKPKIFYHCYDHQHPTGGQKDTYQHVDVLTANGYDAYVVHTSPGVRLSWFGNDTRIISHEVFKTIHNPDCDFVVLPEDMGPSVAAYPGRKVIFNKNIYSGFRIQACKTVPDVNLLPSVVAIFTVSEHNQRQLRFAYPDKDIMLVHYNIRADRFEYRPLEKKKPIIACLPKEPKQIAALKQMLQARSESGRSSSGSFRWVFIRDLSELQVSSVLADSLLFVFLSTTEGLPRMPLEAMASGCLVIAYGYAPLTEYLPREYGFVQGELAEMGQFVETITDRYPYNLDQFAPLTESARRIAEQYSGERQERSVLACWERILSQHRTS